MPSEAREFDEIPSSEQEIEGQNGHHREDIPPSRVEAEEVSYNRNNVGVSTDATQTEGDAVDGAIIIHQIVQHNNNGPYNSYDHPSGSQHAEGGFLSSLFTMVRPKRDSTDSQNNIRSIATQTEEQDPICARGQQLSHLLIQELSLQNSVSASFKDDVYESLASFICDMLVKHSILFNGMVHRCQVTHYHIFSCIANEIFEANETGQLHVTWGRIISLFAFAVRLAQEYRGDQSQVEDIIRFLASYVTKHLVPFVRSQGGWENLVEHYPVPVDDDAQIKRAMMWSGLCVGLMATMYVTSYLSSR